MRLVRGSNVVRNLHFVAPLSAALSVDGYTLTLAANPWNIVRTYNLTPGRELLFACRYRLGTASNFVVYMSEADNVYDPLYGSFVGDQGAWSTAKMYFTVPPNGVAKLHFGAHFQAPGLPNQTAGTVDVYGLQILDATLEAGSTAEEEDTAASALLLKHEFLDGGADDVTLATLGEVLLEPTLTTLGNFLVRSNSQSSPRPASRWEASSWRATLSAFAWNIVRTYTLTPGRRYSFGCRYRLGTASNLVMYVSAADNDYVGVTGTFLGTPSQGVWSTAPGLLGAAGRNREAAAVGGHAGPAQHADQGLGLRGRVGLRDGPAGGLAGPHGLGHAGRAHRAGQRGLRPAAVQRRELHRRVHHGRGRLGRSLLRSAHSHRHRRRGHADVHGGGVRQLAEHQRRGLLSSATGITGSTLTIGQRRELHHGGRRVHGDIVGLGRSNRGELRGHRGAHGRHADDHRGGLHGPAGLREPGLCRRAAWSAAT